MRSPRQRGFTLLEILIAMTLLAMLMGLAVATLRAAVSATRSGERLITRTNETRTVHEFLRRQLSHAMALPFERLEDSGENRMFVADGESMRFVAPMPGHLSRGGPHVQWLALGSDANGTTLEFDHAQLNGYDPEDPKAGNERPPVLLLDGMRDARFEYRTLDENGELTDWSDVWEDPQRLPIMVRLVAEFDPDDNRVWPTLEIPVLAGTAVPAMFGGGLRNRGQPQPGTGGDGRQ
ncbi:prepilin-type N-terminal cleavage/methylation domain-containing protein [Chiayiivirga flava]|uniref:General secretion pathway protein J n=1 Tax=Chiayiivirga flava TaxID=659595 RepID=A0A7W8D8G1_9GAMM|nr:prepilin-type N-terminal cleavage/methylation domain-containing protein [Chiayiivirga flava]MBB5208695.1 general secretion pathway protein J [Chiayiivirga flava]